MIPNKKTKDRLMVQCDCVGGHHDSFVMIDHSEATPDNHEIWFSFVSEPSSFWDMIRQWRHFRMAWHTETFLSLDDVKAIRNECDKIINKIESPKSSKSS